MKSRRKGINIDAVRRLVIFGAIGIIALALGWLALNQNTESRSKAAVAEKIYRNWEFKGSLEGWVGENQTSLRAHPNALRAEFPSSAGATVRQDRADADLPYGNKYLKARLLLTPGVAILGVSSDESVVSSQGLVSTGDGGYVTADTIDSDAGPECIPGPNVECLTPETGQLPAHPPVPRGCQPMPPCVRDGTCLGPPPPEDGWCPDKPMPKPSCTPPPPPCKIGPCPKYNPPPPRGGWCPTTKCRPCPVRLINGACPALMDPGEGGWCPEPPPKTTPVPGGTSFTLAVYYQLTGKTTWEKPVVKTGLTSKGSFAEYPMLLPGIAPMTIAKLKLQVSNVKILGSTITTSDYTMLIDSVRLTGPVPKPTPKPTCTPEPPCLYSEPACAGIEIALIPPPGGWCPRPTTTRKPTPNPTCTPEPPCFYSEPYCRLDIPVPPGGWCPRPTPSPTLLHIVPNKDNSVLLDEAPKRKGKHWTCRLFPNRSWCK